MRFCEDALSDLVAPLSSLLIYDLFFELCSSSKQTYKVSSSANEAITFLVIHSHPNKT